MQGTSHLQLSLNHAVRIVSNMKDTNFTKHCFQFVIVLNLWVVGVLGQQPEPRFQETNLAQYFYFRNSPIRTKKYISTK